MCVNITIVTYNRLEFTQLCLEALIEHTQHPHTITVVDNGSTDGSKEWLIGQKEKSLIRNLILHPENKGIAIAANDGWEAADTAHYLKLDNDIVIKKSGWLGRMVEVADAVTNAGAVAYNFETVSYSRQEINGCQVRPKREGNLGGCCILIPGRTHEKLGFWCEDYGLYSEEDHDYGKRINMAGLLNIYMDDEDIGVHLPLGKAPLIDKETRKAMYGNEDPGYRSFKDEAREKALRRKGPLKKNFRRYKKTENLYLPRGGQSRGLITGLLSKIRP